MKKKYLFLLACLIIGHYSHAQLDTFDLSTYKLPNLKYKLLDLEFSLTESSSNNKTNNFSNNIFSFGFLFNPVYSSYSNSEKIQNEQQLTIRFSPEFHKTKQENFQLKGSKLTSNLDYHNVTRFYKGRNFFEPGISFIHYFSGEGGDQGKNRSRNMRLSIPLSFGKGRIEQVQDARHAIYIIEELYKQNRINRIPDHSEIIELAKLVSEVKRERFFDFRHKRIYEIEMVDSLLQAMNLISNPDARYFTTLNDHWLYASRQIRQSGFRFSGGLEPEYTNSYDRRISPNVDDEQSVNRYSLLGVFKINYHKPINLTWQKDVSFIMKGGYFSENNKWISNNSEYKLEAPIFIIGADYSIGFFPNSRTDLTYTLSANSTIYRGNETGEFYEENYTNISASFGGYLNFYYYIAPQLRFRGSSDHSYYYGDHGRYSEIIKNFRQNVHLSLVYSLF